MMRAALRKLVRWWTRADMPVLGVRPLRPIPPPPKARWETQAEFDARWEQWLSETGETLPNPYGSG